MRLSFFFFFLFSFVLFIFYLYFFFRYDRATRGFLQSLGVSVRTHGRARVTETTAAGTRRSHERRDGVTRYARHGTAITVIVIIIILRRGAGVYTNVCTGWFEICAAADVIVKTFEMCKKRVHFFGQSLSIRRKSKTVRWYSFYATLSQPLYRGWFRELSLENQNDNVYAFLANTTWRHFSTRFDFYGLENIDLLRNSTSESGLKCSEITLWPRTPGNQRHIPLNTLVVIMRSNSSQTQSFASIDVF